MAFQVPGAVCIRHRCLMRTSNKNLEQNMASLSSALWPSVKSSLEAPWRNLRQRSPRVVASRPKSLGGQRSALTQSSKAEHNVSPEHLRFMVIY